MIEETRDFRRVRKFRSEAIDISQGARYFMSVENGEDVGVWFFHPAMDGMLIHADMGQLHRGVKAADDVRKACEIVGGKIYAAIPQDNRAAQMMAAHVGFDFVRESGDYRCYVFDKSEAS